MRERGSAGVKGGKEGGEGGLRTATPDSSPTLSANAASSNGFCIFPRVNEPRSPPCAAELQQEIGVGGGVGEVGGVKVLRAMDK